MILQWNFDLWLRRAGQPEQKITTEAVINKVVADAKGKRIILPEGTDVQKHVTLHSPPKPAVEKPKISNIPPAAKAPAKVQEELEEDDEEGEEEGDEEVEDGHDHAAEHTHEHPHPKKHAGRFLAQC